MGDWFIGSAVDSRYISTSRSLEAVSGIPKSDKN